MSDVGAGYTTILSGNESSAIVDFGSSGYTAALHGLERLIDPRRHHHYPWPRRHWPFAPAGSLVISHPHRDHFSGLLAYASIRGASGRPPLLEGQPARFFHPRIPTNPEASSFVVHLVALETVLSGVPEYQLGLAVATCADGPVRRIPLQIGSRMELADHECDVLWPPNELSPGVSLRLQRLVDAYDALAARAAERDDRRLLDALVRVREASDIVPDSDVAIHYEVPDRTERDRFPELPLQREVPSGEKSDDPLVKEMHTLRSAMTSGANCLSLAFATKDRRFVFLGDLDKSLHGEVAPLLADEKCGVIVSAHHGTHYGSALDGVRSDYVLSSVGGSLSERVDDGYSRMGMHLRTDIAGDITASLFGRSIDVTTCSCHRS